MALHSSIQLFIGEIEILAFKRIEILQEIGTHHNIELTCRRDVLEYVGSDMDKNSQNFLGQTVLISVSSIEALSGYHDLELKGVITSVESIKGFSGDAEDTIVIRAKSTSIITDDGPHYNSFSDMDLKSILKQVFQKYDQSKLTTAIQPRLTQALHYSVQNGESAYQYVNRLAIQYGEWFYDDGQKLVFGSPTTTTETDLNYGFDLHEFSINLKPISNNYSFFTNDYLSSEQHKVKTWETNKTLNGYNGLATKKSKDLFPHATQVFVNTYNDSSIKQRLDTLVSNQKQAEEVKQVILKGKSDNPGVSLGNIVKIKENEFATGTFRVTKVKHEITENGRYVNTFESVSTQQDICPNTNILNHPKSDTQTAIVTDNADPDGLSRVKVQFPWQQPLSEHTPWLRLLTPHSGGDKGFHFIPEIGEEVLVDFEGGNAERPFILGALYNGNANSKNWNTKKNDVKAIRTRSGHTIELNDAKGAEYITITDKNRNLITIDTANNNITISALEKMTLNAKNFELNVAEDAAFNIGKNTTIYTENNFDSSSKNYRNTVENKMNTTVGGELIQNSGNAEIQSKRNMKIACGATASFQGGGNVKISKG